jgi:hypothetical protein
VTSQAILPMLTRPILSGPDDARPAAEPGSHAGATTIALMTIVASLIPEAAFPPAPTHMTTAPPLTPEAALAWLASLSVGLHAAAVLDASGEVVAGDAELAGQLDAPGVIMARGERHAIAARPGPQALTRLLRADLQTALDALEAG